MKKKALAFVIPVLCGGGAERVIVDLANGLHASGHEATLISFRSRGPEAYAVDSGIRRLFLEDAAPVEGAGDIHWQRENVCRLRGALEDASCDLAVSFLSRMNMRTLLAARGLSLPVVISERVDPRQMPLSPLEESLRREIYPEAGGLVVQTERLADEWGRRVMPADRVFVIPNMLRRLSLAGPHAEIPRPYVAAAGRLCAQKGFDLLVDAFGDVAGELPQWSLVIAGEGEDRERLVELAASRGVAGRVLFPGFVPDPGPLLHGAEMVVLSSRFEGFPNVLLEAMALGKAVVATDCPTGPGEILHDGHDGLLVENGSVSALGRAILELGRSPALREGLGRTALESVRRFSPKNIFGQWERLVSSL